MTSIKDLITGPPIHQRHIEIRTYPASNDQVVVEGWLKDERLISGYRLSGEPLPSGIIHWMCIRLLVGDRPPTILDAEAEMPGIPHELCEETRDSVKKVIGLPIVSGYSEKIHALLGGVAGCAHLTHLLVVLGPAAIHGVWTKSSQQSRPRPEKIEEIPGLRYLVNSCRLWAEDGVFMRQLKNSLKK
ncbi:MAG: DUF2889 domain-containing protein [Deltaproteobacteria bacterium]|nr:DUF2889 domain-containing protein [Deltaproteobacteria bacterium]